MRRWNGLLLVTVAGLMLAGVAQGRPELYHMVRVTTPTEAVIQTMAGLGLPLDDSRKTEGELEIPLSESDIRLLTANGIAFRIAEQDLEGKYRKVCQGNLAQMAMGAVPGRLGVPLAGGAPTNMTYGSMGGFYNYDEILASLNKMRQLYPSLVTARTSIGKTGEGRDIWMVKISKNADGNESKPEENLEKR